MELTRISGCHPHKVSECGPLLRDVSRRYDGAKTTVGIELRHGVRCTGRRIISYGIIKAGDRR